MAKQCMPFEDCSGSAVLGGEIPQLRPPAFSDDSQYTTFSYTYYPDSSVLVMQSQIPDLTHRVFRISKESLAYYLPKNC